MRIAILIDLGIIGCPRNQLTDKIGGAFTQAPVQLRADNGIAVKLIFLLGMDTFVGNNTFDALRNIHFAWFVRIGSGSLIKFRKIYMVSRSSHFGTNQYKPIRNRPTSPIRANGKTDLKGFEIGVERFKFIKNLLNQRFSLFDFKSVGSNRTVIPGIFTHNFHIFFSCKIPCVNEID